MVAGAPDIVGVRFVAFTVIENAASEALPPRPSLTLITMPEVVPASAAAGVPESRPVDVLKLAQAGRFVMANVSVSLSASDAVGVNPYAEPAFTEVTGVPLIVGARFGAALTVSVKVASEAPPPFPSLTLITMPACVPAAVGVPESRPVLVEKLAQAGHPRNRECQRVAIGVSRSRLEAVGLSRDHTRWRRAGDSRWRIPAGNVGADAGWQGGERPPP